MLVTLNFSVILDSSDSQKGLRDKGTKGCTNGCFCGCLGKISLTANATRTYPFLYVLLVKFSKNVAHAIYLVPPSYQT